MPQRAPGLLTIDIGAVVANWRMLARRSAPGRCAAVVKADAYGLGLAAIAPALRDAGCRDFFVAQLEEGLFARKLLGPGVRIYVLDGLEWTADPDADYARNDLIPAIGSAEELERWTRAALRRGAPAPAAVHLDTGMNRLGFPSLAALARALERAGPASGARLLMSHFVSSEQPDNPLNALQIERFAAARAAFPDLAASLANSSGVFLAARPTYDLTRPGYALYGGNPSPREPNPMRPAVTLSISIQQTRWIDAGETCGYNGQWTAKRRSRLATALVGYADGLPRGAGATDGRSGASVTAAGRRCPLVGRISMDTAIVDVTDLGEDALKAGDWVQMLDADFGVDDLATRSGTIGYQVLTGLGPRYRRQYVEWAPRPPDEP